MRQPVEVNEPATWFDHPGSEGVTFDHLADALLFAIQIPAGERHLRAEVVTESGHKYGWHAIEALAENLSGRPQSRG